MPEQGDGGAGKSVRLFIALDLPADARGAIARWRDTVVSGREELRGVLDDALHVTLVFLGRRPAELVERIWATTAAAVAGQPAPHLVAAGFKVVPPRRPRVLALDLEDRGGHAAALHGKLVAGLEAANLHEPEDRPLWPHVTVARVRRRARLGKFDARPPPSSAFTARAVTLYRSDLHPAGARYVALERLELG